MSLTPYLQTTFGLKNLYDNHYELNPHYLHLDFIKDSSPYIKDKLDLYYFKKATAKSCTLFETFFKTNDIIYLRFEIYSPKNSAPYTNFIKKYFRTVSFSIVHYDVQLDKAVECEIHCYVFKVALSQIKYHFLFQAICHTDFSGLQPRFITKSVSHVDVTFINQTTGVLLNVYDDRGAQLIISDDNQYEKYKKLYTAKIP